MKLWARGCRSWKCFIEQDGSRGKGGSLLGKGKCRRIRRECTRTKRKLTRTKIKETNFRLFDEKSITTVADAKVIDNKQVNKEEVYYYDKKEVDDKKDDKKEKVYWDENYKECSRKSFKVNL